MPHPTLSHFEYENYKPKTGYWATYMSGIVTLSVSFSLHNAGYSQANCSGEIVNHCDADSFVTRHLFQHGGHITQPDVGRDKLGRIEGAVQHQR